MRRRLSKHILFGAAVATLLAAIGLVLTFVPAAHAGGFSDGAPGIWTGTYAGIHGGYGWGEHEGTGLYTDPNWAPCANGCKVLTPGNGSIDVDGGLAGIQLGANFQSGRLVYGAEVDASWADFNGSNTFISDSAPLGSTDYTWALKTDVEWLATLRGRIGYLVAPNLLVYGTGGLAYAHTSTGELVTGFAPQGYAPEGQVTVRASASDDNIGWVAGAGLEWMFAPQWSLKAEWQHFDFGDVDSHFSGRSYAPVGDTFGSPGYTNDSFPGDLRFDTVKLGVNYHF